METIGLMSEQPMCQNPLALQQLKRIWRECFEADDGYLDAYFSIGYRPEQTLFFQDDDTILGMLTIRERSDCTRQPICLRWVPCRRHRADRSQVNCSVQRTTS